MTRIGERSSLPATQERRLAAEADRLGNSSGVASEEELHKLAEVLEDAPAFHVDASERRQRIQGLLGASSEVFETLDPELRALPSPLRRLALEIDSLWGDADGTVSVEEFDRVVEYTLAALPFFADEAGALLELAEHLGYDVNSGTEAPVHKLQMALAKVDQQEIDEAQPFRKLFDEALSVGDQPGAPMYLRDALKHSPRWHSFSILEHTNHAVHAVKSLAQSVGIDWKDAGATMLLHDVGKILERHVKNPDEQGNAQFHYSDHEALGAEWLEARGLSSDIAFHVRHHADLRKRPFSELVELSGNNNKRLAEMVVVYVADQVAKGNTTDQLASFDKMRPKILKLSEHAGIDGQVILDQADALRAEIVDSSSETE